MYNHKKKFVVSNTYKLFVEYHLIPLAYNVVKLEKLKALTW